MERFCVGTDVSAKTLDIAHRGMKERVEWNQFDNNPVKHRALIKYLKKRAGGRPIRVVMESTSDYWKGVYYLLESEGFDCWLVNAREVKNVPGRAKTDLLTELLRGFWGGCVLRGVRLARFAARDRRWRTAAGFGGAGGAGSGWSGGHRRPVPAVSAG